MIIKDMQTAIESLLNYGLKTNLIEKEDIIFTRNKLLELFCINNYPYDEIIETENNSNLKEILKFMLDYAVEQKLIKNTTGNRDLFDTKIMGLLTPRPSEVIKKFWKCYEESPEKATNYYYDFSQATDYIRTYRIKKDKKWKYNTEYGELDITINLSKPEKDPKDIISQKNKVTSNYPKCFLCKENEGYAGGVHHPARQNHRIIPININNEEWGFQYSPYVYYNEHAIVFNGSHTPMKIEKETFVKLLDFLDIFPHYFIGSNADLPIVGGSILSHDHYQAGKYEFTLTKAPIEESITVEKYKNVKICIVKWPMSVLRLECKHKEEIIDLAGDILEIWKGYKDEDVGIYAFTEDIPHNTITPIARRNGENYQLDLVLRNNITSDEYPSGVFHPHSELHNIKKENIGLIEVMGHAVLPSRLDNELKLLKEYILNENNYSEEIEKHLEWLQTFKDNYSFNDGNIEEILQNEVGKVFLKVLECCGVFKRDSEGKQAFIKFLNFIKQNIK